MSTKVYNGFRFEGSFEELFAFIQSLRKEVKPKQREIWGRYLANTFTHACDSYLLGGERVLRENFPHHSSSNLNELIQDFKKNPFYTIFKVMYDGYFKNEDFMISNEYSEYDFSLKFIFYPYKSGFLIQVWGNQFLQDWFSEHSELSEYCYWNNSDEPEYISAEEWAERKLAWNTVWETSDIPEYSGMTASIVGGFVGAPEMDTKFVQEFVRPASDRINYVVKGVYEKIILIDLVDEIPKDTQGYSEVIEAISKSRKMAEAGVLAGDKSYLELLELANSTLLDGIKEMNEAVIAKAIQEGVNAECLMENH